MDGKMRERQLRFIESEKKIQLENRIKGIPQKVDTVAILTSCLGISDEEMQGLEPERKEFCNISQDELERIINEDN